MVMGAGVLAGGGRAILVVEMMFKRIVGAGGGFAASLAGLEVGGVVVCCGRKVMLVQGFRGECEVSFACRSRLLSEQSEASSGM